MCHKDCSCLNGRHWMSESSQRMWLSRRGSRILKWGVIFCDNVIDPINIWGIREKKKAEGSEKKGGGGENSPISPPLDLHLIRTRTQNLWEWIQCSMSLRFLSVYSKKAVPQMHSFGFLKKHLQPDAIPHILSKLTTELYPGNFTKVQYCGLSKYLDSMLFVWELVFWYFNDILVIIRMIISGNHFYHICACQISNYHYHTCMRLSWQLLNN